MYLHDAQDKSGIQEKLLKRSQTKLQASKYLLTWFYLY